MQLNFIVNLSLRLKKYRISPFQTCYFASTATSKPLLTRSLALPDAAALVCQRAFYNCLFSLIFCQILSNISPVQFWFLRVKGAETEVNGRHQQEDHRMAITTRKHGLLFSVSRIPQLQVISCPCCSKYNRDGFTTPCASAAESQHPAPRQLTANTSTAAQQWVCTTAKCKKPHLNLLWGLGPHHHPATSASRTVGRSPQMPP